MKTFKFAATLGIALTFMATESCSFSLNGKNIKPSNNYVTKKIELSDISSIKASTSIDVVYTQTKGESYAEVYAPDNIAPYVKVHQNGDKLEVCYDFPKGLAVSIRGKYECEVKVFAPEVTTFTTSSSSDITLASSLETAKDVNLKTSSSGDIDAGKIQCSNLNISSSSSGDIAIKSVTCRTLEASASSSGDLKIATAHCNEASLRSSSSGDCDIKSLSCTGNIQAQTSSSGDIHLSGKCTTAEYSSQSSGSIYAQDLKASQVKASASSGGDILCHATETLSTSTSSGGEIRYNGNPRQITGKSENVSKL